MKTCLIISFSTLLLLSAVIGMKAQIPQFKLSQKSLLKIEQAQSAEKKLKLSKRLFGRDSLKFNKTMKRYYRHLSDSLATALSKIRPSSKLLTKKEQSDSIINTTIDSLGSSKLPNLSSEDVGNISLDSPAVTSLLAPPDIAAIPIVQKTSSIEQWDGMGERSKTNGLNMWSSDSLKESFLQTNHPKVVLDGYPAKQISDLKNLGDTSSLKEAAKKKTHDYALKYLSDNPQVLNGIQNKMSRLMKKYSSVPNSNDLSAAVKQTSLHGQRFKERLFLALNLQTPSIDPLTMDISPAIGYRINAHFIAGFGMHYRQAFSDSIPVLAKTMWGCKVFSSYDVVNQFFVYGEFNRNVVGTTQSIESNDNQPLTSAALAGVGRKFRVHRKLESTIVVLYNFLHKGNNPIYSSPWSFRVGIQSSALSFR